MRHNGFRRMRAAFELRSVGAARRCELLNHEDIVSVSFELLASSQLHGSPINARACWPRAVFDRLGRVAPLGLSFKLVMEGF